VKKITKVILVLMFGLGMLACIQPNLAVADVKQEQDMKDVYIKALLIQVLDSSYVSNNIGNTISIWYEQLNNGTMTMDQFFASLGEIVNYMQIASAQLYEYADTVARATNHDFSELRDTILEKYSGE
jgi:hypothetical protein